MSNDLSRIISHLLPILSTIIFCLLYFLIGLFNNKFKLTSIVLIQILCLSQFFLHAFAYKLPMLQNFALNFIGFFCFWVGYRMRVIGLTGGIACGKSTVSQLL